LLSFGRKAGVAAYNHVWAWLLLLFC
jgi:hypothetical protein